MALGARAARFPVLLRLAVVFDGVAGAVVVEADDVEAAEVERDEALPRREVAFDWVLEFQLDFNWCGFSCAVEVDSALAATSARTRLRSV